MRFFIVFPQGTQRMKFDRVAGTKEVATCAMIFSSSPYSPKVGLFDPPMFSRPIQFSLTAVMCIRACAIANIFSLFSTVSGINR